MKKILLVATGAFLMVENAMCSQPRAENPMGAQQGGELRVRQTIDSAIEQKNGQFPGGTPIFEKFVLVTVKNVDESGNKQKPVQEQFRLRISSESQQLLNDVLRSFNKPQMADFGAQTNTSIGGAPLEEEAEYMIKLLKIKDNATPYVFMKTLLDCDSSKIEGNDEFVKRFFANDPSKNGIKKWDKVKAILSEWRDELSSLFKLQEAKKITGKGNHGAFWKEYRESKNKDGNKCDTPLLDSLYLAINDLDFSQEKKDELSIGDFLSKLLENKPSGISYPVTKKWYADTVLLIGDRFLDERTNSLRTLFEKALETIAYSEEWHDDKIKQAVNLFCEIPTNEVIKTYPELIDQILDTFRGRLCISLQAHLNEVIKQYFKEHKDLPKFSQQLNGLDGNLDNELNVLVKKCDSLLFQGSSSPVFDHVLSIIFGIDK